MRNIKERQQDGYALTELIVSMAVFVTAAILITGIFIQSIKTQRQVNHLTVLNSDTGLVLEKMIREIREGYNFSDLPENCQGSSSERLTFNRIIDGEEETIQYSLNRTTNKLERREGSDASVPMNSSEVSVESLCFLETQEISTHPWRITVNMRAGSINQDINYTANIQTTISARPLPEES